MKEKINQFKLKCREYLSRFDIHTLRGYGRYIGVSRPAAKNKEELLDDIVAILAGELAPVPISKRGAPVKNNYVDPKIDEEIENKLIGNLDTEINRILHLNQHMSAEDIGAAVVQYAEKKRLEVARGAIPREQ